ncbi:MAG TPA: NAD(P)H-dependent oxidoreductase [Edaphocola sp.]|nr:NAD(P)H-dependent oxidoreductase [Edaphocola sp.]
MINLKILTSTTRDARKGIAVANWITEKAKEIESFKTTLLDLKVINLPFMDEPNHPRLQQYTHEHTKQWSATIEDADAYIIVLGEYNYGYPAPIKNAIDYLYNEWKYKPVAFVSYGGISAGLRSTQMLKQVVTTLNMVPVLEQVNIPYFSKLIDEEGIFHPDEHINRSSEEMFKSLINWNDHLKNMRK